MKAIRSQTCAGLCVFVLACAATPGFATGAEKIDELRKEKVAVLEKFRTLAVAKEKAASITIHDVIKAEVALLRAKLDIVESKTEKIELLTKLVAFAKDVEKYDLIAFERGLIGADLAIKAMVERIDSEIELEKAKTEK